eukprot:TRINITY_DN4455_c0_g2_i7.p3 TRINITY_DN4455_c0_g2~~TRINITY_DN4455_c0_g2_i7.p3  ORF type:complete len:122 (+),score=5.52 TRINITY_DN4455_c0_g2_i7:119-484(+)
MKAEVARAFSYFCSSGSCHQQQALSSYISRVLPSYAMQDIIYVNPYSYHYRKRHLMSLSGLQICMTHLVPMTEYGPCCEEYTVVKQESMCDIAARYELDCGAFMEINDLEMPLIGQQVQIC